MALEVKNPPANAGDVRGMASIPGLERSPGEGNGNTLQYSAWKIPWSEELGGLQSMGSQESDTTEWLNNNNIITKYISLLGEFSQTSPGKFICSYRVGSYDAITLLIIFVYLVYFFTQFSLFSDKDRVLFVSLSSTYCNTMFRT